MNKENNLDYEFLLSYYIDSYMLYHDEDEVLELMKDIINKKDVAILSNDLQQIDKSILSNTLSKMVIKQLRSNNKNKFDFSMLLPDILKNSAVIKDERIKEAKNIDKIEKKIKMPKIVNDILKRKAILGAVLTLSICAASQANNTKLISNSVRNLEVNNNLDIDNLKLKEKKPPIYVKIDIKKLMKNSKELEKEKNKRDILSSYKKCKSINDILKRQKELESLHLTAEDKIYKECKLSPEIQRFIYEQSIVNEWPVDFTFAIISTETRGGFDSSGEESYNAPGNYDLGLTQQNCIYSVKERFIKEYNISYEDAYELVKNNDFVNVISAFLEYEEIRKTYSSYDSIEYAGCYNGWLDWRKNKISRQYVNIFEKSYNNEFTNHHNVETKKLDKENLNKKFKRLMKKINA